MSDAIKKSIVIFLFLSPVLIGAAVIQVPGDRSTIQEAIDIANNGDTVLVADGTYTGTGNKNLDFGGKVITVKSENGPGTCVIDCEGSGTGFHFHISLFGRKPIKSSCIGSLNKYPSSTFARSALQSLRYRHP